MKNEAAWRVNVAMALAEAIRALGSIPSGELYARVMGHLTLEQYEAAIALLVGASAVKKANSGMLTWVGK